MQINGRGIVRVNMEIRLSIIVPIYRVEKYLKRCIDSILNQKFRDFELILVNDGSPDSCGDICDEYSKNDTRIKVIHKKNGGLSSARNAGIEIAQGEYIGFVDSDDWINEDMYEVLYSIGLNNDLDIVECTYSKVFNTENLYDCKNEYDLIILDNISAIEALYKDTFYGSVVSWNKIYRKNLFKDIRFPLGKINEDQFTTYKLYYNCNKIGFINRDLYYYYQSVNSITRSSFTVKKLDVLQALEEARIFFQINNLKNLILRHDTLYSDVLIKYYLLLSNEDKSNLIKRDIKTKYNGLLKSFLLNPYINKKRRILQVLFYISPQIYQRLLRIKR